MPPPQRPRRPGGPNKFRRPRRKVCAFCVDKSTYIDYKQVSKIRRFVTDRGKMVPRRSSGTCATHQRPLSTAIKRARQIALIPYVTD